MELLKLRILGNERPPFETILAAPIELGRQRTGEPEPYALIPPSGDAPRRLIIAGQQESNCSRQHMLLQPLTTGHVRVTNRSQVPLQRLYSQTPIPAGGSADLSPPFGLVVEGRTITVTARESAGVDEQGLQGLDGQTVAPGALSGVSQMLKPLPTLSSGQFNEVVAWLQTTVGVLQSTVGGANFLEKAAEALVQIVGLDSGRVLLLQNDAWTVVGMHGAQKDENWRPSRLVMRHVVEERRTFWQQAPPIAGPDSASLTLMRSVVASPLLNGSGQVIGALYGERRCDSPPSTQGGGKLEAILAELLACGVSTGLARQEQQRNALKMSVLFEQFFTKDLAQHLEHEPDLLQGREAMVSVLFCDVRGFSSHSERLGPAITVRWISDVMGELSDRVLADEGVLVDYVGDELLAMWGAPRPQPDQAARAVRAALAMRDAITALNQRWQKTLGVPMDLGIGINTGLARVGNTGSHHKFKYGPLGNSVNLASRVQGLTKYLRCQLLVSEATRNQLDTRYIARRVCTARVVNIQAPVALYEVELAGKPERAEFFRASEAALIALEKRDFSGAARQVGALLNQHLGDGPLLLVLSRTVQMLMRPEASFDPVWEAPGK